MKAKHLLQLPSFWALLAAIGLALHLLAAKPLYAMQDRLLAWVLLVIFIKTTFKHLREPAGRVPLLPFITLQIYVLYGIAQFTQERILLGSHWYEPSDSAIHHAMLLVVAAELGFLWMFMLGRRISHRRLSWSEFYPSVPDRPQRGAAIYGILVLTYLWLGDTLSTRIPADLINIFRVVFNYNLALVIVLYSAYRSERRHFRIFGLTMVAVLVFWGALSSMIENMLVPVYLLIITDWIWGRTIRTKWIAVALASFVILSPIKHQVRGLLLDAPPLHGIQGLTYHIVVWGEAIRRTWDAPFAEQIMVQSAADRTSALLNLAQVIDWVPSIVPYREGGGILTAVFYWTPRIFWRDKPSISDLVNNAYAVEFGYSTYEGIQKSTFGIVQPADGYWEFGNFGAMGYMMGYGLLLGLLIGGSDRRNPTDTILAVVFSSSFLQVLAGLHYVVASLFSLFAGAWLALLMVRLMSGDTPRANHLAAGLEVRVLPTTKRKRSDRLP